MFFIFSKVLLFLISPSFWIILLLLWSFLAKKENRKRKLRVITLCLFIIFSNPLIYRTSLLAWQPKPMMLAANQKYSVAIHLGGITMTNRYKQFFFGLESDRFIQTTKLFHTGVVDKILVSGGSPAIFGGDKIPEADHLRGQLLMQGIPDSCIIIENRSWNTYENAVNTKRILDSLQLVPPYVLVTSAMHIPRATAVFKKAGLNVTPYPSAFKEVEQKLSFHDFVPSVDVLDSWNPLLKELVGLIVYRITGKA